ncbi:hypothetical protein FKW77_009690 [Venturia effusa]|uniref:RBR-type E3 ubiquitin transferase n=1 Tax=Venturia effusa TaxID=50376 RepID=A0A517L230_9PEZI|nr:hypothetical protein FKW77_009690 [Venturia effusa]
MKTQGKGPTPRGRRHSIFNSEIIDLRSPSPEQVPKSRPPPGTGTENLAEPSSKRRKLNGGATRLIARSHPDSDGPDGSSDVNTIQDHAASQDCTKCGGRGKLSSKLTVKDQTGKRGKEIPRRGHEKTSCKRCRSCKSRGKRAEESAKESTVRKPSIPRQARQGERRDDEEFHIAPETQDFTLLSMMLEEEKTPTERDCSACAEEKPVAEYGYKLTETCDHARRICQDCVVGWVEAKISEGRWNTITCPECKSLLEYSDISQILSQESGSFKHFDDLATKACLNSMGEYRHCLSPTCKAGQLHSGGEDSPIFMCRSCGHKSCTIHNMPWHEGEICADYDTRVARAKKNVADNAASEAKVAQMKACPKCKAPFKKNGGCDHMTCTRCRFEFCYLCLVDYALIRKNGNAFHGKDCRYHTRRLR